MIIIVGTKGAIDRKDIYHIKTYLFQCTYVPTSTNILAHRYEYRLTKWQVVTKLITESNSTMYSRSRVEDLVRSR